MANAKDFALTMDRIIDSMPSIIEDSMVLGLNEASGLIQDRVFNQNKDISGFSFGGYKSESYKKKRQERGFQISVVDLQFEGNLKKDLVKNISTKGYSLLLNSKLSEDKARGYEKRSTKKIFELSEDEEAQCFDVINDYFSKQIVDAFSK